ncbi:MAG: carboxymethylenebutenolidase [Chloroflexota bacterium]|jgi:carboxymethylenebutenolidase|nr:carboxymethylenebutenolidase [Chloroflexota bacterium]
MDENTIQKYLVEEELDHYADGWISRREFIRRATIFGVGTAAATAMAASVAAPARVRAAPLAQASPFHVEPDDPAVSSEYVFFTSDDGVTLKAYMAWPNGAPANNSLPGVIVCHQNRGANEHILDVTRRFAKQGYVALAPDLPSRFGAATDESTPEAVMAAYRQLNSEQNARDFRAGLEYLSRNSSVDASKLAANGYCFGGGVIWRLTTIAPQLTVAAPFYGGTPPLDRIPNIKAAVLGVYASLDTRGNAGIPDIVTNADAAGLAYEITIYGESEHGFHDDTQSSYNPVTAVQAWKDMLNWFAKYLNLPAPTF